MMLIYEDKIPENRAAFVQKVYSVALALGINPNWLMAVMYAESKLDHRIQNPSGTATGLIQFLAKTASDLGTTTAALKAMSNVSQLDYVEKYFVRNGGVGKMHSYADVYKVVAYPAAKQYTSDSQVWGIEKGEANALAIANYNKKTFAQGEKYVTNNTFTRYLLNTIPEALRTQIFSADELAKLNPSGSKQNPFTLPEIVVTAAKPGTTAKPLTTDKKKLPPES